MGHTHQENEETLHLHAPSCDLDLCHPGETHSDHAEQINRHKFYWAMGLTGTVMIFEVAGGILTNSLALLSDAGHMLTHLLALLISFLAMTFSTRPATTKKSFGFYRLEILAALLNGFVLFIITLWILYEAYQRFFTPEPVATTQMMIVAIIGLVTNLVTVFLLRNNERKDINTQSAILHLAGDTFASVGVVAGAGLIALTGWMWVDPALGVLISILILYWAVLLIRDAIDILLESTPKEIDPENVIKAVKVIDEVQDMHDVHVWTLTSGMYALSAHVAVRNMPLSETAPLLKRINFLLCQQFKIGHAAIQLEAETETLSGDASSSSPRSPSTSSKKVF